MIAIARAPDISLAHGERTHIQRLPIDFELALKQHRNYCLALQSAGAQLHVSTALEKQADSVFVEDVLVVLPEVAILCNPGAQSRRSEVAQMSVVLQSIGIDRPIEYIPKATTLDGGDVLCIAKQIFVGVSTRTNLAGVNELRRLVGRYGYHVTPLLVPGALHLKTAMTAITHDLVLVNPSWLADDAFDSLNQFHKICVSPNEPFAANALRVADKLFLPINYGETIDRVSRVGVTVTGIDISELAKAEAGLTCMSVII